jgi:hypothetical protein
MVRFSLEKIAKGDLVERAGLIYELNPRAFASLAKRQGYKIQDLADVQALAKERAEKRQGLDFQKIFKAIPIKNTAILEGAKRGIKID